MNFETLERDEISKGACIDRKDKISKYGIFRNMEIIGYLNNQ